MYAQAKSGLLAYTSLRGGRASPPRASASTRLAPGTVDTDMVRNNTPDRVESMKKSSPLGRMADADEMVGPALLLASDAGSYITGAVISADGGLTVH
ncbi:SDR family oxidoreductase [Yinghuangia aomiensis]